MGTNAADSSGTLRGTIGSPTDKEANSSPTDEPGQGYQLVVPTCSVQLGGAGFSRSRASGRGFPLLGWIHGMHERLILALLCR